MFKVTQDCGEMKRRAKGGPPQGADQMRRAPFTKRIERDETTDFNFLRTAGARYVCVCVCVCACVYVHMCVVVLYVGGE